MSTKGLINIECPHCGERFDADFWTVVRGDIDAEVKDLIISGEFDLLACPKCATVFSHEEPFLYLDPRFELLVFVMPENYLPEKEKWLAKMKEDYAALGSAGLGGFLAGIKPEYFFGVGELCAKLARDRDMEEESEVLACLAGENNFKTVKVKAGEARLRDLPFCLPYSGPGPLRGGALSAVKKLLSVNDALPRLKNLLNELEALSAEEIPFI
ncbi:MAG: CpXC domain-containing protein [Elusimicrobia bacterium]|nr:CpXC domain-containing protein [Elusimicrobiota bacterium]